MASSHTPTPLCQWFCRLAVALDPRSAPRLARLLLGALLAVGRRTVTDWIRTCGLSCEFRKAYTAVAAAGKRAEHIASGLLSGPLGPIVDAHDRVLLAIDDTPTPRYGPHVQGAGLHHNPTPGPSRSAWVYGHVWVALALVASHPSWGAVALPLLASMYVRKKDLGSIDPWHRPAFRTKLRMAAELLLWATRTLSHKGKRIWLVADGAYAKRPLLGPAKQMGVTVVSRLRRDAALCSLPGPPQSGPGRRRVYGQELIDLAGRALSRRGWSEGTFELYGRATQKRYKTFRATWRPAGGEIRVVLVWEPRLAERWVAFFCTDPDASVADILGAVADRFSLETAFRDVKEVVGAGRQQVRFVHSCVGALHICLWTFTLTEAWAWGQDDGTLSDRTASPWDDPTRRPSHADKRRACRRHMLAEEFQALVAQATNAADIESAARHLLNLAA